jgi:hypothetical protein
VVNTFYIDVLSLRRESDTNTIFTSHMMQTNMKMISSGENSPRTSYMAFAASICHILVASTSSDELKLLVINSFLPCLEETLLSADGHRYPIWLG